MSSNKIDMASSSTVRLKPAGSKKKMTRGIVKYPDEVKLDVINRIKSGEAVAYRLSKEMNVANTTIYRWMQKQESFEFNVKLKNLMAAGRNEEASKLVQKRKESLNQDQVESNIEYSSSVTDLKRKPRAVTPPPPLRPAKKVTTPIINKISLQKAKTYTAKIMTQPSTSSAKDQKPNLRPRVQNSPSKIVITDNSKKSSTVRKSPRKSIINEESSTLPEVKEDDDENSDDEIEALKTPSKIPYLVDIEDSGIITPGHLNRCIARESEEAQRRPGPASKTRFRASIQKPARFRSSVQKPRPGPASKTRHSLVQEPTTSVQEPATSVQEPTTPVQEPTTPVQERAESPVYTPGSASTTRNIDSTTSLEYELPKRPGPASKTMFVTSPVQTPPETFKIPSKPITIRPSVVSNQQQLEFKSGIISRASYEKVIKPYIETNPSPEKKPRIFVRCSSRILPNPRETAPKDSVGPGENSWAAQTSQAPMPSTSRAKEMSPRPSTSATHTGGFLIKQDPGTPPPVQQQVMNPYIQEPPMVQSAPRLLPKPSVPPPQSQVQQQPRLRVRQPQHVAPAPAPPDPDPEPQQVCLRWNSFHNNMQTMFPTLLNKEKFVDVTLACEGQTVKCHKVVLSSCSAYIERLLTENPCKHPIILMPNTMRYWQIRALVDFMYRGEVNVEHEQLSSLLAAAEFLQVKGLAGPPTSPEQNTNMEDPEPEPPLSPRPKRKRVASPSPVPQHRQPVATPPTPQPQQQQQQQQQRTSLPNSPAVSITRLKQSTAAAQATPSTSRDTGSRAQSPGIEITPVVSFEEIKMEPIDISDSNDESMDPNMHCDVDYDMDNGDGEGDKDYDDEDLDEDSGDAGRGAEDDTGGGGGDADPGPSLQPSTSDDQPGTSKTTSNGPDLTTPGFSGNGIEIDDSAASYCAADLGLTTEPPEDPPDSGAGPSGL